jgi:hypothetical protein
MTISIGPDMGARPEPIVGKVQCNLGMTLPNVKQLQLPGVRGTVVFFYQVPDGL